MNIDMNVVMHALNLLWMGMLGIFVVIVIVMLVVAGLSKADKVFPSRSEGSSD